MAKFTDQEKQDISDFLDAFKRWWNSSRGTTVEQTWKDRLIQAIDKIKEEPDE